MWATLYILIVDCGVHSPAFGKGEEDCLTVIFLNYSTVVNLKLFE